MRFLLRTLGGLWSLLMILLTLASLALSVAMTIFPAVLGAVATGVEAMTGRKTVVTQARARETRLLSELETERVARRTETAALRRELAEHAVPYRGTRVAMREAVHDTAERVARRSSVAAGRTLGSTVGEALPVVGVGVIVAATAWELRDSCELMKDMRALDAAFNPDDPVSEDEICGLKPPTRDEVWQAVRNSPGAAWDSARGLYGELPEISLSASYDWTLARLSGIWDWSGDDVAAPDPAAHPPEGGTPE